MAILYVKSGSSNTAPYDTWAKAATTLAVAAAASAAGDTIYVSNNHSETQASTLTVTFPGTVSNPSFVICADDGAAPPTALSTTGAISTTGNTSINVNGSVYCYGLQFTSSDGTGFGGIAVNLAASNHAYYENCLFYTRGSNGGTVNLASLATCYTVLKNCTFRISSTSGGLSGATLGVGRIIGGQWHASTSSPTTLFTSALNGRVFFEDHDLSNLAAALNLESNLANSYTAIELRNVKMPASWSGVLFSSALARQMELCGIFNTDNAATNYYLWVENYGGSVKHDTATYRTGGANGVTSMSWKLVTNANTKWPTSNILKTPQMAIYNAVAGSPITITVDILFDSVTNLTDKEIWIEVDYMGSSATPLGTHVSDAAADFLTTAADQTASSATWTNSMGNPNKQKLSVTFTPQMAGLIFARVYMAKASATIYVDPILQVS